MKIVGYKSRASIHEELISHPLAKKYLTWKFTKGGGKLLILRSSLMAFLEAIAAERQTRPKTPPAALSKVKRASARADAPARLRCAAAAIVVSGQTSKRASAGRAKA
jgi:hypothetical protein